jgi:hypothetical protein
VGPLHFGQQPVEKGSFEVGERDSARTIDGRIQGELCSFDEVEDDGVF